MLHMQACLLCMFSRLNLLRFQGAVKGVASCVHAAHAGMFADLPLAADVDEIVLLAAVVHPHAASEGAGDWLDLSAAQGACSFACDEAPGSHSLAVDHHLMKGAAAAVLAHALHVEAAAASAPAAGRFRVS